MRHRFNPWVGKIPWKKKWHPTPVFLPGKSHGQRKLAGNSLQGSNRVGNDLVTKNNIYYHTILIELCFFYLCTQGTLCLLKFTFHMLGWPNSSFGFFHNILWKKSERIFWPNQYEHSVQFRCSVVSNSVTLRSQNARLPCPLPTPRACSNSCPSSW